MPDTAPPNPSLNHRTRYGGPVDSNVIPTRVIDEFIIQPLVRSPRHDAALEQLLHDAYVPAGFTEAARATALFRADAVHARGFTFGAHDASGTLLGTVTLVPGGGPACRIAAAHELEVHLLAVRADARGRGVGEALVTALLDAPEAQRATVAWLWTQAAMTSAQRLYQRLQFERVSSRDFRDGTREFLVYARPLSGRADLGAV